MSLSQVYESDSPLYAQVRELIVGRIHSGEWQPGALIPGDAQLAQEYDVSQGTVRKAIDSLVDDRLVTRRQGKGTFLASHNPQKELFHFFHLVNEKGELALPTSKVLSVAKIKVSTGVAQMLSLPTKEQIICIKRVRMLEDRPTIFESIYIGASKFHPLAKRSKSDIPNTLYELYEKEYGVMIRRAKKP